MVRPLVTSHNYNKGYQEEFFKQVIFYHELVSSGPINSSVSSCRNVRWWSRAIDNTYLSTETKNCMYLLRCTGIDRFLISLKNENGILLPKLIWSTVRKNCSSDQEKLSKFETLQILWETRTFYSNSERSGQFLVTECLFNFFVEVSQI